MRPILKNILCFSVCCLFLWNTAEAQPGESSNASAAKLLNMARNAERVNDLYSAVRFYENYLDQRPKKNQVRWDLAQLQEKIRDYDGALNNFELIHNSGDERFPLAKYRIAAIEMRLGEYEKAKKLYQEFSKEYRKEGDYKAFRKLVKAKIAGCDSSLMLKEEPLHVVIDKLSGEINNPHVDASPFLEGDRLIFSSLRQDELTYFHIDSIKPKRKFYQSSNGEKASEWVVPGVGPEVDLSSGAFNAAGDRFYFSQCETDWKNQRVCNLYRSDKVDGSWSAPEYLEAVNMKGFSSSMPTVAKEAKKGREVVYFVSDRPEGKGGKDIWYTSFDERKQIYRAPRNLGNKVNSSLDELSPYYDRVERKLYFSSEGWSGLGGFDIYTARGELRKYNPISNVGYPINTGFDEVGYVLSADRKSGYLVSNRSKEDQLTHPYCCDDIYAFEYPDQVVLGMGGYVMEVDQEIYFSGEGEELDGMSSLNSIPLPGAEASLYLIEDGEEVLIEKQITNEVGIYYFDLEENKDYRVEVSKEGYLRNNIDLSTVGKTRSDTLYHNFGMSEITIDEIVLENIEFDFDSDNLNTESVQIVERSILNVLLENPEFGLKINAHTDNRGDDDYNLDLSQRRAKSMMEYLISRGVDSTRLQSQGYGETRPIAKNNHADGSDNPEGRERNRRIEVQLIPPAGN